MDDEASGTNVRREFNVCTNHTIGLILTKYTFTIEPSLERSRPK